MRFFSLILCVLFVLPASAQDWAVAALDASPRHHEWTTVESRDRDLHLFVAYPESSEPAPTFIVIHENRGLTDSVRLFADQAAEAGYLAVAVDLLSGFDEQHGRTSDFESSDAARSALYELDPDGITQDLLAAQAYALGLPASDGLLFVAGFCWGGSQTFRFATNSDALVGAMVFYGSSPEEGYERIEAPVWGFYGENDARINRQIPGTETAMEELGKTYHPVIYPGAGHAFMRRGDDPSTGADDPNKQARDAAWERIRMLVTLVQAEQG
ncbi:MAG: dienelactone hydrolase family protein [Rhodothermales bacterium]|nr:dienelactone hydrolase family protein [Rhodothermales bacterium]